MINRNRIIGLFCLLALLSSCSMHRLTLSAFNKPSSQVAVNTPATMHQTLPVACCITHAPEKKQTVAALSLAITPVIKTVMQKRSRLLMKIPLQKLTISGDSLSNTTPVKREPLAIGDYDLMAVLSAVAFVLAVVSLVALLIALDSFYGADIVIAGLGFGSIFLFIASVVMSIIGLVEISTHHHKLKGLGFAIVPLAGVLLYFPLLIASLLD
jgi:hypothetical protein